MGRIGLQVATNDMKAMWLRDYPVKDGVVDPGSQSILLLWISICCVYEDGPEPIAHDCR